MIKNSGSALIYILIAIALLGALTMSFIEPSSQQSRSQNSFRLAQEIKSQAEKYRAAILDCILTYPAGDTSTTASAKYTGYNHPYPLTPSSTYLPVASRDAQNKASSMRCPGNPGDSNDHALIFGGTTGQFAPTPPALFEDFLYFNSSDGVYILARTDKTDPYLVDAMDKAAESYTSCEAESVDDTDTLCATGYNCFILYLINTSC